MILDEFTLESNCVVRRPQTMSIKIIIIKQLKLGKKINKCKPISNSSEIIERAIERIIKINFDGSDSKSDADGQLDMDCVKVTETQCIGFFCHSHHSVKNREILSHQNFLREINSLVKTMKATVSRNKL